MANSTILYAGTPQGLGIVNKPGTSTEWLPLRTVLQDRAIASVWAEPGPPIRVIAVTSDGQLLLSENGGRTWNPVPTTGSVATVFEFGDQPVPHLLMEDGTFARSTDGGATWETLSTKLEGVQVRSGAHVLSSGDNLYLLASRGGADTILRGSLDNGEWTTLELDGVVALALDADKGGLHACTPLGVYTGAGSSWALLEGSPRNGTGLAVIPGPTAKPPALLVSTPTGLSVSPDSYTWQVAELPHEGAVTAFVRDPERRDRIYAATDTGYLLESGNRGQSWQAINSGPIGLVSYLFVVRI